MGMDSSNIRIRKNGNRNITVYYEDYQFDTDINMEKTHVRLVPKIDSNGKKIGILLRDSLNRYLIDNYDLLSLPDDIIPIKLNEAKDIFNLTLCDPTTKDKYLDKKHSQWIYILFFVFLLFNFSAIISVIANHYLPLWSILCILIPVFLMIASFLSNRSLKKEARTGEIYSGKVSVYDRKVEVVGEGDLFYYIRVWDNDKHVLMNWFSVSKRLYNKIEEGILFVHVLGNQYAATFETDDINN